MTNKNSFGACTAISRATFVYSNASIIYRSNIGNMPPAFFRTGFPDCQSANTRFSSRLVSGILGRCKPSAAISPIGRQFYPMHTRYILWFPSQNYLFESFHKDFLLPLLLAL